MIGRFVRLSSPIDEDFDVFARWLTRGSLTAVLTSEAKERVTPDDLRAQEAGGRVGHYAVHTLDGELVGVVTYRKQGPEGCYVIGGAVGDDRRWGQGLGAEAFALLLDVLFHGMGARRVQCTTALYNKGVLQVMVRSGFVVEGLLREYYYLDGAYHGAVMWALLRSEYYEGLAYLSEVERNHRTPDVVPAADKEEAVALLRRHLREHPGDSSLDTLLATAGEVR